MKGAWFRYTTGRRQAFTLTELLVAATIAMSVMAAIATLFSTFSRSASNSQAIVDMTSRMRSTAARLRDDLAGVTATLRPPLNPQDNLGYFELIEGPATDARDSTGNLITGTSPTAILADTDDSLLFTTRAINAPFTGKCGDSRLQSSTAEVAWFCRPSPIQPVSGLQLQTLYRRQLLVMGYVGSGAFFTGTNQIVGTLPQIYATYDLSLRRDPVLGTLVPNTLADLGRRENRFLHGPTWSVAFPNSVADMTFESIPSRQGEDVVLTNVIAFDVRVFDTDARPRMVGVTPVYPSEQGYDGPTAGAFQGCMLDLGRAPLTGTVLGGTAAAKSQLTATYDTWTTEYETNGINDGGLAAIDEGSNGLDDDGDGVPDDVDERETLPPYPRPLRALEIRLRCYDPTSKEIRQLTVRHTFTF